ncbi:MAG: hypothetical protein ACMG6E_05920 [Candidatus Roizmanbacteria bacterium]
MSQFEKIVLDTVRSLCSEHDFERELVIKKEQQKQKMILQIRESLKFLNPIKPINPMDSQGGQFYN